MKMKNNHLCMNYMKEVVVVWFMACAFMDEYAFHCMYTQITKNEPFGGHCCTKSTLRRNSIHISPEFGFKSCARFKIKGHNIVRWYHCAFQNLIIEQFALCTKTGLLITRTKKYSKFQYYQISNLHNLCKLRIDLHRHILSSWRIFFSSLNRLYRVRYLISVIKVVLTLCMEFCSFTH